MQTLCARFGRSVMKMASGLKLISLRLGFRRNFLSVLHPNLVSSPIKGILEILNLTTRCIPCIEFPVLCVLQYYYQYCWMKNTGASNIVCFTILVLPVLLDEEYWSFQYRVFYNTSITSIVG
jgi:hypothetical protein